MQALADEAIPKKTEEYRRRVASGESLDDLLPEAFALAREAAVRTMILRLRGFDSMQELIDRQQQMMIGDNDTLPLF